MSISIVPASLDLAKSYWDVLDVVAREREFLIFTEGPPFERTETFVRQIVSEGWTQFYAVDAGTVVGWCDIIPLSHAGQKHIGHLGMGVHPEYRGRGLGGRLLESALDSAFAGGLSRVELEVFACNAPAVSLYRKSGFVEEGCKRDGYRVDGCSRDLLMMALVR